MIVDLAVGVSVGVLVGLMFFGGLRWTLSRLESSRHPTLLVTSSFLIRVAIFTGAVIAVAQGGLTRVLATLGGLLIVRTAMVAAARREFGRAGVSQWT